MTLAKVPGSLNSGFPTIRLGVAFVPKTPSGLGSRLVLWGLGVRRARIESENDTIFPALFISRICVFDENSRSQRGAFMTQWFFSKHYVLPARGNSF